MDINQLNCFISVAQTLNFSEAARRNYVSQSTVSRYVSDLEKEFGVKLFARSHRDVIITNEGKTLLPYAIEIVDTLSKAKTVIKQMNDGDKGRIVIGCDVTSVSFPSKCIADFKKRYPGITVDVRRFDGADRNQAITSGDYDFCFMPRDMVPESSGIETLVTHFENLAVVGCKNSRFSGKKSISLCDLTGENLLLFSENICPIVYMEIMDLLRTFHISPDIQSNFDDIVSMYVAISSGLGYSIIPKSLAAFSSNEYSEMYAVEDVDTSIVYVMAWKKSIANPAAKLFIKSVSKFAQGEDNIYGI